MNTNKKICYVVTLPITIKAFFIPQLRELSKNGFDVTVVCSPDLELSELLGEHINYIPINIPRGVSFGGMLKAIFQLIKLFKNKKFDLVQYSTLNASFCASLAGFLCGVKIRNYHMMGFRFTGLTGIPKEIIKCFEKITGIMSTHIECVSVSNKEIAIRERVFNERKISVIWNGSTGGVDLNRFCYAKRNEFRNEIRNQYSIQEEAIVFGFVGRITRDKGVNEILTAFKQLDKGYLFLIGSKEGLDSIDKELVDFSNQSSKIFYTGHVECVEKYFAAIDVLLLPSYREGFGNVIIEAAAMGTPAIVTEIPGPKDAVVSGITGYFVPVKNSDALFNLMSKVYTVDLAYMGRNAEKYARECFDSCVLNKKIVMQKIKLLNGE